MTRPGGLVAAAGISRYAGLLELAAFGQVDEETEPDLARDIATGVNDPESGFTVAYFHTPDELVGELRAAGLVDVTVYGVEGPSVPALMTMPQDLAAERLDSALRTARLVERDPALIAASPHLLAVGRVTGS